MNRILSSKYWWLPVLLILIGINYVASIVHGRYDLTQEKRYTLSQPSKRLLESLDEPVNITVFLDGEMPAGFRRLANSSREMLEEFREVAGSNLSIQFERPGEGLDDTSALAFRQYLQDSLGLRPTNVKVTASRNEAQEERMVYAGALVTYKGRELPVNFLEGQNLQGGYQSLNNAESLLEYRFANAIQKITADEAPVVGYLIGNGQPLTYNVYDLIENTIRPRYGFSFVPIDSVPVIPQEFDAVVIMKPTQRFNDVQKLKIDQYLMHGGKVIWLIDNLYAEMDSLMRTQSDFVAFDRGLNLEDQLFRYGVRINQDLVQDLQSDKVPLVVGSYGDQPQMQLVPWPYFPLLGSQSDHPISKNLDYVLSIFPNSIDTVNVANVEKSILLSTSANSRTLSTPAIVSLNSVQTEDDLRTFNREHIPVAVLLEGTFSSLYQNRLSTQMAQYLESAGQPFRPASTADAGMIVVSDADIAGNVFTQNEGPLPMGYNQFTGVQYANREFFLNCLEYLVNPSGILETRSKDFTLRMLDTKKVEEERVTWQLINIVIPVVLILIFAGLFHFLRIRKYAK